MNLPRAIVTEKAFPEDEAVVSTAVNATGAPGVGSHIIHEQRFGMNNQIEVDVPITFEDQNHTWYGGVGDTTFGVKRVMFSSLPAGSIFSLQGSVIVPTGNKERGFGTGTTTFETFASFDQLFSVEYSYSNAVWRGPAAAYIDFAAIHFFNTAVGQSLAADHGMGRLWSPMVEFLADRDLVDNAKMNWDLLPQMQVTRSTSGAYRRGSRKCQHSG